MSNQDVLEVALRNLSNLPDYLDFYKNYLKSNELKSVSDYNHFLKEYKAYLFRHNKWKNEFDVLINIMKEKSLALQTDYAPYPISLINTSRKINDSWIKDFKTEFYSCLTGDTFAEKLHPKKYKTITEKVIVYGVNGEKLSQLFNKYSKFNHPLVNYKVSNVALNGKSYSQGLPVLEDGIRGVVSYPNIYWNNEYGIEGATWLLADLLSLLNDAAFYELKMHDVKVKLLKILFLYMSRYIHMTKSNIACIDFYSNRANIVKANWREFITFFDIGVNPDIQYISDKYLAYQTAVTNEFPITEPIMQLYWDSMKMYRHGSHIPNSSGGYQEIEDDTWSQLIRKGELRSVMLASKLLKEFENYELNISNSTIDKLFDYLYKVKQDDTEKYLKKLNKEKLS